MKSAFSLLSPQVGECLGSFMRSFRDAFKPFFESVSPLVLQMLVSVTSQAGMAVTSY